MSEMDGTQFQGTPPPHRITVVTNAKMEMSRTCFTSGARVAAVFALVGTRTGTIVAAPLAHGQYLLLTTCPTEPMAM